MASSGSTDVGAVKVIGTLLAYLVLLCRVKSIHSSVELDRAISFNIEQLRYALILLAKELYPGMQLIQDVAPVQSIATPVDNQEALEEEISEEEESAWDPSSKMSQINFHRCKALLLDILKRAAYDWVLYRTSRRKDRKELASDAYLWLFEEAPGHPRWHIRERSGHTITSFVAICEVLDIDPDKVREHVRKLSTPTVRNIDSPAKNKKAKKAEDGIQQHCVTEDVCLDTLDTEEDYGSYYDSYYTQATPSLG